MKILVDQIGNTPLSQELKDLPLDELRQIFVYLGEHTQSRVLAAALLETYAKEMRRRKAKLPFD